MRLFVALEPDPPLADAVADLRAELCPRAPQARWVAPEAWHLTLRFIGEVAATRESEIVAALGVVRAVGFEWELRGLGVFPDARQPRALWLGAYSHAEPALADLAFALDTALAALGIAPEPRAYRPHLTLARARQPGDLRPLLPCLATHTSCLRRQPAREFILFASRAEAGRHVYESRARFALPAATD